MEVSQDNFAAFISYRHKPLDIAVAEELIKLIERYRVPKELRKNGSTSLGRVFRDRDELGVHHDLEEAIYPNLDKSDFLIVVCTPDTRDSEWVSLEIERFLQTHDRDHILVVHAAGTAEEAIPEQITHIYDENGNLIGIKNPLSIYLVDSNQQKVLSNLRKEFLKIAAALMQSSYDSLLLQQEYRMPRKKLKNEILRLISALLGCPYDELQQRNKKYLYQRLMIFSIVVASFLLIFAAVVFHKNTQISDMNEQIQEQLRQTQLNESEVLTLMSRQQLEDGDRMEAIRSALAALPNEENERPYYPEAANALAEALDPYGTNATLMTHSSIELSAEVVDMAISNDGNFAVLLDEHNTLQYCNIHTGEIIWSLYHDENPMSPDEEMDIYNRSVNDSDQFLFLSFSNDGAWIIHATPKSTCILASATGEHIRTIEYPRSLTVTLSNDDKTLAVYTQETFRFYDITTGEEYARTENLPFEDISYRVLTASCFSADNSTMLAVGFDLSSEYYYSGSIMHFALIDPKTGSILSHTTQAMETDLTFNIVTPLPDNGFLIFSSMTGKHNSYLLRMDANGEIQYNYYYETILDDKWYDSFWTAANEKYFICEAFCTTYLFDLESGDVIYHYDASEYADSQSGAIGGLLYDDFLIRFRYDGTIEKYEFGLDSYEFNFEKITGINIGSKIRDLAVPRNKVSMFCALPTTYSSDENIAKFIIHSSSEDAEIIDCNGSSSVDISPSGKLLLYGHHKSIFINKNPVIESDPFSVKADISFPEGYDFIEFCGFNADEDKLIYTNGITQSWETGEISEIDFWYDLPTLNENYGTLVTNSGESISYNEVSYGFNRFLYREPGEPLLSAVYHEGKIHWWLDDQHFESSPCPYTDFVESFDETASVIVGENKLIMIRIPADQIWSIDHYTGSTDTSAYIVYSIDDDSWYYLDYPLVPNAHYGHIPTSTEKWIVSLDTNNTLYIYDLIQSSVIRQISFSFSPDSIEALHFLPGDTVMLAFLDNDFCHIIDTATGEELCERIKVGACYDKAIQIDTKNQRLFLYGTYSTDGVIIDMNNWSLLCQIKALRGYLAEFNKLLLYDENYGQLVAYPAYTVAEMIEMAREMVGQ